MDLALHVMDFTWPGGPTALAPTLAATARAADQSGFATLTLMDHYFQMENAAPATDPMLEGYTGLGFIAGQTESIELGLLVTGVTYRSPGLLAKIVATLDVLSGGRAMLGIGAAWYEREHLGLGVPYPPVAERFERLEETLQIVDQMWGPDDGAYAGTHYQLAETLCVPAPLQSPRPPILIGGMGEKKTLRLVARYADACNLFPIPMDQIRHKLDVLTEHCEAVDRDPATVQRTVVAGHDPLAQTDEFLATMQEYAALGITKAWVRPPMGSADPAGWVSEVGERVLPRLRDI